MIRTNKRQLQKLDEIEFAHLIIWHICFCQTDRIYGNVENLYDFHF